MPWRTPAELAWLRGLPGVEEGHSLARHTSFDVGGQAESRPDPRRRGRSWRAAGNAGSRTCCSGRGPISWSRTGGWRVWWSGWSSPAPSTSEEHPRGRGGRPRRYAAPGPPLRRPRPLRTSSGRSAFRGRWAGRCTRTPAAGAADSATCWWRPPAGRAGRSGAGRRRTSSGSATAPRRCETDRCAGRWWKPRPCSCGGPGDGARSRSEVAPVEQEQRNATQPISTKNCGSVFGILPATRQGVWCERRRTAWGPRGGGAGVESFSTPTSSSTPEPAPRPTLTG